MNLGEFIIKIGTKADTKELEKAVKTVEEAEKKTRRLINYLKELREATSDAEKRTIKKNFAHQVEADKLRTVISEQNAYSASLQKSMMTALKFVGAAKLALIVLDRMGNNLLKANQMYVTFNRTTGISINRLNRMAGLARLSGMNLAPEQVAGDIHSLQQKLFRFRKFGEGADTFGQLGINPMGMSPEGLILGLRKALKGYAPEVKSFFLEQLGLSQEWVNVLDLADEDFKSYIKEASLLQLDAKERHKLAKMTAEQQKNNMRWELARQKLLISIMPMVQDIMEFASKAALAFSKWIDKNPKWIYILKDILLLLAGSTIIKTITTIANVLKGVGAIMAGLGLGAATKGAKSLFGKTAGKGIMALASKKGIGAVGSIIAKRAAVGIGALAGGPIGAILSIALAVWTIVDIFNLFMKRDEEKDETPIPDTLDESTRYTYHNVKSNMTNNFYNNPQPVKEVYSQLGEVQALLLAEKNR